MISINASNGFFKPKNKNDHNEFRANCIAKKIKADFTSSLLVSILFQTNPAAIPIII